MIVITLVYWNVSCLPVKVASIERGVVSIWHMPGAEHRAEHGCASLSQSFSLKSSFNRDKYEPA